MSGGGVPDLDAVIIGGGAVGLAIARALAMAGRETVLLEQHDRPGTETSARNSGVIHAGLYYQPGSLKARLCVAGKRRLYDFARDNGVAHRRLGKLLVAVSEAELPALGHYAETAKRNGVDDLESLTGAQARSLEPQLTCAGALLSPSTGIIDAQGLMMALAGEAESHGAKILPRHRVEHIARLENSWFSLKISGQPNVTCRSLVMAAGLHTSQLARQLAFVGGYIAPLTYFARGRWYGLRGQVPFSRLVYPMPAAGGLGIHLTLDMAGRAKFGPDIDWVDRPDYAFEPNAEAQFYAAIRRYWPALGDGALAPDGTGIRPKLSKPGEPVADFAIHGPVQHGCAGLVMLFGIESPGLTACLAIADEVRERLTDAETSRDRLN